MDAAHKACKESVCSLSRKIEKMAAQTVLVSTDTQGVWCFFLGRRAGFLPILAVYAACKSQELWEMRNKPEN